MIAANCNWCGHVTLMPNDITLSRVECWFSFFCVGCHTVTQEAIPPEIVEVLMCHGHVVPIEDWPPITPDEQVMFRVKLAEHDYLAELALP